MYKHENLPIVSVIIPCRNEQKYLSKFLDSIVKQDYPKEKLEIIIVDGKSEDQTIDIAKKYSEKYKFIKVLNNDKKITPVALNIGIRNSFGDIIIRMDAHSIYEHDYISKCVFYLKKYKVDNIGGISKVLSDNNNLISAAISLVLSNSFGVGNSYFRIGSKEPKYVDTVPFGCYYKRIFEKIGYFNENLIRNQDIEFNLRIKKNGGKILLAPDIVSYYFPRENLKSFFIQNYLNGFWVIYSLKFCKTSFSIRHLIPLIFVSSLVCSTIITIFVKPFFILLLIILSLYITILLIFSIRLSLKKGTKIFFPIVLSFLTLHFSYGIGSIFGTIKLIFSNRLKNV